MKANSSKVLANKPRSAIADGIPPACAAEGTLLDQCNIARALHHLQAWRNCLSHHQTDCRCPEDGTSIATRLWCRPVTHWTITSNMFTAARMSPHWTTIMCLMTHHRRAIRHKFIKHVQQHANIERMQANRGLIEHEYGIMLFPPHLLANFKRCLTARQRGSWLAQRKLAQTQFMQRGKLRLDRFDIS